MSKQEVLRQLVRQRLDEAAEHIFGLFEKTIEEYEEKLNQLKKSSRQAEVQTCSRSQLPSGEDPNDWNHNENQQNPERQALKQEQEEVLTGQEEELLPELKEEEEEEDGSRFPVAAVCVKSEEQQGSDGERADGLTCNSFQTEVRIDEDRSASDSESEDEDTEDEDTWQRSLPDYGALRVNGAGRWTVGGAAQSGATTDGRLSLGGPKGPHEPSDAAAGLAFACLLDGQSLGAAQDAGAQPGVLVGDKVFSCEVCGQRFNRRNNLRGHMRVHSEERPFQCGDCGKRFRQPYNLRRHRRVHSGQKPFGCNICCKRFTQQAVLVSHMSVHSSVKPFSCDVCGRTFGKKSYLKTHMLVHSGEKPFSCGVCQRRFTRKGDLKRHMLVHLRTNHSAEGTKRGGGSLRPVSPGAPHMASENSCGPPT